jgi:hypothetical protein
MVVALWFYGFVGLVAPWWVVPLMLLLWLVLALVAWRRAAARPWVPLVMPAVAMGLWFAIVAAGGAWFGWSG